MNPLLRPPSLALAIAVLLTGCGASDTPLPGEISPRPTVGSAEDRRAAQALSIGNVPSLDESASPYVQALRCSIALEMITQRLAQGGGLPAEQVGLIREAQLRYEREAARLGAQDSKSPSAIRDDRRQQGEQIAETAVRGRIAIGCLRRLA